MQSPKRALNLELWQLIEQKQPAPILPSQESKPLFPNQP